MLPGGFGKTPGRHRACHRAGHFGPDPLDRSATMFAGLGQTAADNARRLVTSQEVRLKLSGGVGSLPQVPRWNAGRRAGPAGPAPHPQGAAVGRLRLPAFCLLSLY